jgi:hypothetical protein
MHIAITGGISPNETNGNIVIVENNIASQESVYLMNVNFSVLKVNVVASKLGAANLYK